VLGLSAEPAGRCEQRGEPGRIARRAGHRARSRSARASGERSSARAASSIVVEHGPGEVLSERQNANGSLARYQVFSRTRPSDAARAQPRPRSPRSFDDGASPRCSVSPAVLRSTERSPPPSTLPDRGTGASELRLLRDHQL
jgi:hypothetical protein